MKIGILTQPLQNNYGGLLQNFALQKVLKDLGHEPLTVNIVHNRNKPLRNIFWLGVRALLKISGRKIRVFNTRPSEKGANFISQHTGRFVKENINTTKLINRKVKEMLLKEYNFDAYIVGSDQVWRPRYSPQQSTFFLDFLEGSITVKKIAYAASFGVSEWEFKERQTAEYARLLKQFDVVSVREDSAVGLCKKYFDIDAIQHLDPTMLLDTKVYTSIVKKKDVKASPGNLFTYILDKSDEKNNIVNKISDKYNLIAFSVMPRRSFSEPGKRDINDCVFPPVEEWLRGFMDAEFVVTDSFHGSVFSILFNKPFIAVANKSRGLTRFTSLLKIFQLEDRLIFSPEDLNLQSIGEIDWDKVNNRLSLEKDKAINSLSESLNIN